MTNTHCSSKGPARELLGGSTHISCALARSLSLKVTLSWCSTISPLAPTRLTKSGYICLPIQFISGKKGEREKKKKKKERREKQARSGTNMWATHLAWVTATGTQIPKAAPKTASSCSINCYQLITLQMPDQYSSCLCLSSQKYLPPKGFLHICIYCLWSQREGWSRYSANLQNLSSVEGELCSLSY